MLKIQNLSAGYSDKHVLNHVNTEIPMNKITVVFGPNGCGKSTLLKTICGLLKVKEGNILLNDEDLLALDSRELAQKVTYLAQGRKVPDITVKRLVLHGRFPYLSYPRKYRKEDYEIADMAMNKMQILDLADKPLDKLSGGQRQKAYIAMALAQDTPIILLDEPTTYLDIKHQIQLLRETKNLIQQDKTVVMIVHDLDQAMNIADYMILMENGNMVIQGTPEEIYESQKVKEVFGVQVNRVKIEQNWRYFCEEV